MTALVDPRYSPGVIEEDRPPFYEQLGAMLAPGLASALALHESRDPLAGPRCRPCKTPSCFRMSVGDAPYCGACTRRLPRAKGAGR